MIDFFEIDHLTSVKQAELCQTVLTEIPGSAHEMFPNLCYNLVSFFIFRQYRFVYLIIMIENANLPCSV